ncbi:MAG: NAD(P)/FAD-dependent oxidoreductase [Ferrovibrionaceae bacterium]
MPTALVLGAGMAGVGIALQLQRRGWSVTLVDRKPPGLETSYGNAGIIQAEAVEPYPMPRDLAAMAAIALGRTNDVHYEWRALFDQGRALFGYWRHSAPRGRGRIAPAYAALIRQATSEHQQFITLAGADALIRRDGFRVLHRSRAGMDKDVAQAERLKSAYGVAFRAMTPDELRGAEPALAEAGAGAVHWLEPWTVSDPGALVQAYADYFCRAGGRFASGEAGSLQSAGSGWRVDADGGRVEAEHAVVALGPWSPEALRPLGYRIPMVRKRGYHRHYKAPRPLELPLMDAAHGYVLAPMARGMRITTGAHLARTDLPSGQLQVAEAAARGLIALGAAVEANPWSGTRPCMPDMLPVIGPAPRHRGLWLHFGHGHQGFTLGPATGRLLAEMMTGAAPFTDPAPYSAARF